MKKLLLLCLMLVSGLGFSQTVSGSIWIKPNSYVGYAKWVKYADNPSNYDGLIKVDNIYWSPTTAQCAYPNYGDVAMVGDWVKLLNKLGLKTNVYGDYQISGISNDENNPTQILISEYSDLLLSLHLSDNVWIPQTFHQKFEIHFKINSIDNNLANDEFILNNISLYPNPTKDIINFNTDTNKQIILFNMNGQKIVTKDITSKLDISTLDNGVYMATIIEGEKSTTKKIVKI